MLKKKFIALLLCAAMMVGAGALAAPNPMAESSYSDILANLGFQLLYLSFQ